MRYLLTSLLLFLCACASVQSPQGGPKDSEGPVLLKSNLKNGAISYREKSIVLEYSENVLENEAKQPFLSPLTPVTVIPTGKKIRITPDSGWKENQTYELRLNKKIKDEHEGNTAADTSLIFSTGKSIDTGFIEINAENLSGKNLSGKNTLLLTASDKTQYCSSGEGSIRLGGLAKGSYRILLFQDKNENLKYEEEDGRLYSDSIRLDSNMRLKCRPLPQMFKPLRIFHLRKKDTLMLESSRQMFPDSVLLKNCVGNNEEGTLFCLFPVRENRIYKQTDSLGNLTTDTCDLSRIDSSRSLPVIPLKRKLRTDRKPKELQVFLAWTWKIFRQPELIEYSLDSVWKKTDWEKTGAGIMLKLPVMKPGKIRLRFDTLLFYNRQSLRKDSIMLQSSDLELPGKISGNIETDFSDIKVELIGNNKELTGKSASKSFQWFVSPGQYRIQVYRDINGDGRYTGGNKLINRKAEPLYIYPEKIELKPGWDLENIRIKPEF
jgi:uncharacterized protein (DUF2141 family)